MGYKFEKLEVWKGTLDYVDVVYKLVEGMPAAEEYNLKSQMIRAATSIALNIAEGSTSQSNAEQARFLSIAIRSLIETVACMHLMKRRAYIHDSDLAKKAYQSSQILFAQLQSIRSTLLPGIREEEADYEPNTSLFDDLENERTL